MVAVKILIFLFQNLDDKYKNFPKLIETMENIIENQVRKAERENEIQIKRFFNQEKEYINTGHKNFTVNIERKTPKPELPPELNILDFGKNPEQRKEFYNSKFLNDNTGGGRFILTTVESKISLKRQCFSLFRVGFCSLLSKRNFKFNML